MDDKANFNWYVLKTSYNREIRLENELQAEGIETFIPMQCREVSKEQYKQRIEEVAIHNLVFVKSTTEILDEFIRKSKHPITYLKNLSTGTTAIISEKEMQNFILITKSKIEGLRFLDENIDRFCTGDKKVRVTGGMFDGLEGYVIRIRRDRKLVIRIEGITAVAVAGIHASLLQKCKI